MLQYTFNADFQAYPFSATGATTSVTSKVFKAGTQVNAATMADSKLANHIVTADGFDITNANTTVSPVASTQSTPTSDIATNASIPVPATTPDGKTFCSPCKMKAINNLIHQESVRAAIGGGVTLLGIILWLTSDLTSKLKLAIYALITFVGAFFAINSVMKIYQLKKMKDALVVIPPLNGGAASSTATSSTTPSSTSTNSATTNPSTTTNTTTNANSTNANSGS